MRIAVLGSTRQAFASAAPTTSRAAWPAPPTAVSPPPPAPPGTEAEARSRPWRSEASQRPIRPSAVYDSKHMPWPAPAPAAAKAKTGGPAFRVKPCAILFSSDASLSSQPPSATPARRLTTRSEPSRRPSATNAGPSAQNAEGVPAHLHGADAPARSSGTGPAKEMSIACILTTLVRNTMDKVGSPGTQEAEMPMSLTTTSGSRTLHETRLSAEGEMSKTSTTAPAARHTRLRPQVSITSEKKTSWESS
mmetsp:Transcript_5101/g.19104  ORF Transcript_5101/g.19104 Transcript_5101/m.19104 type:complete len:249 (+) Transcript_5101:3695-4441(+)